MILTAHLFLIAAALVERHTYEVVYDPSRTAVISPLNKDGIFFKAAQGGQKSFAIHTIAIK